MQPFLHNKTWQVTRMNPAASRWTDWTRLLLERLQVKPRIFCRPYYVLRALGVMAGDTYVSRWSGVLQQFFQRISLALDHVTVKSSIRPLMRNVWMALMAHTYEKQVAMCGRTSLVMNDGKVSSNRDANLMDTIVLPVQRVLARTTHWVDTDQVSQQRISTTTNLTEMCHRAVRRVMEKCERVEERRMQSLVLRRESRSPVAAVSGSKKEIIATSPWGPSVGKPGLAMTDTQIPIDLNRLTDQVVHQIDSRIVAYRERMGKVF
jgi:hypothetical protein